MKKSEILTALAAVVSLIQHETKANDVGKCYGIAKAGKNDCASEAAEHTCAHQAKVDNDANEWVKMNKEDCQKEGGIWKEDHNK